jgi:hypothetical protein
MGMGTVLLYPAHTLPIAILSNDLPPVDEPLVDEPCGGHLRFLGRWILTNLFITQANILASALSTPAFVLASL